MHFPSTLYVNHPSCLQSHGTMHLVTPFLVCGTPKYGSFPHWLSHMQRLLPWKNIPLQAYRVTHSASVPVTFRYLPLQS